MAAPKHAACALALLLIAGAGFARAQGAQQQTGPVIIPKTAPKPAPTTPAPPPPPPQQQAPLSQKPQATFSINVPEVQIPVTVQLASNGEFVPNLTAKQFRIYEDGVEQKINKLSVTNDAPMTVLELVEFRNTYFYATIYQALEASYYFTQTLQPQDWVALVTFDLKPTIMVDFTHDKRAVYTGLNQLTVANFSESDLFDSLSDMIDRLNDIQGHKVIVLIASGLNTFSHMNYDQLRKKLQQTQGVTIYSVSLAFAMEEYLDSIGMVGGAQMSLLQADNEMRYFAKITGGLYFQPRFVGEFPDDFRQIAESVRSQYTISYTPTNSKLDGTVRKIKVALVAPDGQPLKIVDPKGKTLKYTLNYRDTYTSRHVVE